MIRLDRRHRRPGRPLLVAGDGRRVRSDPVRLAPRLRPARRSRGGRVMAEIVSIHTREIVRAPCPPVPEADRAGSAIASALLYAFGVAHGIALTLLAGWLL